MHQMSHKTRLAVGNRGGRSPRQRLKLIASHNDDGPLVESSMDKAESCRRGQMAPGAVLEHIQAIAELEAELANSIELEIVAAAAVGRAARAGRDRRCSAA
jgi:hypothetical protein